MSSPQTMILTFSPDAMRLLSENGVDLLSALRQQGLELHRAARPDDLLRSDPGAKSIELIILASAAAAPMVAGAIARVIDALGRNRRAVVTPYSPKLQAAPTHSANAPSSASGGSKHSAKISYLGLTVEVTDAFSSRP